MWKKKKKTPMRHCCYTPPECYNEKARQVLVSEDKEQRNACSLLESINWYHQFGNSNSPPSYIPNRIHVLIV